MTQTAEKKSSDNGTQVNGEPKTRKSPVYKLTPEQLTKQVISLETKDLQALQTAITNELQSRKYELQKKLAELEGKG